MTGLAPRPASLDRPARPAAAIRGATLIEAHEAAIATLLVALGAGLLAIGRLDRWDEMWFLQVSTRLAAGNVLYRDVFFGAGPVAPFLGSVLVAVFGSEALPIKAAGVAVLALMVLLLRSIAIRVGRPVSPLLLGGVLLVLVGSTQFSYAPLATLFLLACFGSTLAWWPNPDAGQPKRPWLAAAGVCAGLAVATKQDVGVYAAAAVGATIVAAAIARPERLRDRLVDAGLVGLLVALVPLAAVLPILVSGGGSQLLDYAFLNKGRYLSVSTPYLPSAIGELRNVLALRSDAIFRLTRALAFAVPPGVAVLGILAWHSGPRRDRVTYYTVLFFFVAGVASIFPRADGGHVVVMLPVLLAAAIYWLPGALETIRAGRWSRHLEHAPGRLVGVCLALAVVVAVPLGWRVGGARHISTTPHLRGLVMAAGDEVAIRAQADALRSAAVGRRLFLLTPDAGLFYLLADLHDPTPFDLPLLTSMGRDGEEQVIEQIVGGSISVVCVGRPSVLTALEAVDLIRYVETHLEPGANLGSCRLYHKPNAAR